MKAFFINSVDKTISEAEYFTLKDLQKFVGGYIERARFWSDTGDNLFVNEEGLIHQTGTWFLIEGNQQPLAGNGILVGREIDDEGNTADPAITLEQLTKLVRFLTPEQVVAWSRANASEPATSFTTFAKDGKISTTVLQTCGEVMGGAPGKAKE